ncbi:MAG: hypothetical protein IPH01_07510 [Elusimicrobia bacterium]|nr:hypothetical protein [Elusimicrobiota bacterium]MBK8127150.1 hypothetical protein [Elusimicrobiota bacterium]MBK8424217.1 hypothetical protein [Elusimicrobiota bacterium]MBL0251077.1 hypothetical protein [Elusimicrobiota bacterium]
MKKTILGMMVGLLSIVSLRAADLVVSSGTHVVAASAVYDNVTVDGTGSLVVINYAELVVNGVLTGRGDASLLVDRGTIRGRINVEASRKFHMLNGTLIHPMVNEASISVQSRNLVLAESVITASGADYVYVFGQGAGAAVTLKSDNDIRIRNVQVNSTGGLGQRSYYGIKAGGFGRIWIESAKNIHLEDRSTLKSTGAGANVTLKGDVVSLAGANVQANGRDGYGGTIQVQAQEANVSGNTFYCYGGDGLPGAVHGGTIYEVARAGGNGSIAVTGKTINLADNSLRAYGGAGGYMPPNPSGIGSGGPGTSVLQLQSDENTSPSLFNNSYTAATINIVPASINNAPASTVETVRRGLEDFQDRELWSPGSTLGWWDIDNTLVYRHTIVDYDAFVSPKAMRVEFNKQNLPWSLFGGFIESANPQRDFGGFNTVRVWAKGDTNVLLKLRDRAFQEQDVAVHSLASVDDLAVVDFNFAKLTTVNRSDIDNLLFFTAPGQANLQGAYSLNAIELTNTVPIEDFEDEDFWTPDTTVGWWDVDGTAVYRHTRVTNPCHEGGACMKTEFTKNGHAWSVFGAYVSGMNPAGDARGYRKLAFWLRGNVTLLVKMTDRYGGAQDLGTVQGVADGWKRVELDFSDAAINRAGLENILFFAAPGETNATGVFYLDDLKLIK